MQLRRKIVRISDKIKNCFKNTKNYEVEALKILSEQSADGIYISDMNNYEMLYINDKALEIIGLEDKNYKGRKCYEYLMGADSPCSFCNCNNVCQNDFFIREYDRIKDKHLVLRGKEIKWNGRKAHIEYITDDTEQNKISKHMKVYEEMMETALNHKGMYYWYYDIIDDFSVQGRTSQREFNIPEIVENYSERYDKIVPIHKDSMHDYRNLMKQILTGSEECSADIKMRGTEKDRWLNIKYTSIFDSVGNPIKAYGSAMDITEYKAVEMKYQGEVSDRKNTDSNIIGLGIYNLTIDELVEYHSKETGNSYFDNSMKWSDTIEMFGKKAYRKEDLEKIYELKNINALIERYMQGKSETFIEYQRNMNDGSVRWVKTIINLNEDVKSQDIIAYIHTIDVNDIKISEKIIKNTIASEYDYIAYVDGINDKYTLYVNRNNTEDSITPISGYKYEHAKNYLIYKYVVEEERERVLNNTRLSYIYEQLENSKDLYMFFSSMVRGKLRRKKLRFTYMDKKSKRLIISEVDVSEIYNEQQKKNEILKSALMNAESANKTKLSFLSNMSHDLRTPMNAIVGMTELSMENIDDKEKVLEYLKVIKTSSNHLLSLINDILTMSKIENGHMVLIKEKVYIPTQIDNIRQISEDMFKRKKQKFDITINLIHNNILTDSLRINRVIINLLNNASKFTQNGGRIELKVIEIPTENNKYANIKIIVKDNGIGISKEKLPEVFKPFYTDNNGNKSENDGVGLGLTIAKSVVESNGGMIKIDSKPMVGTKITIDMHFQIDKSINEVKKKDDDKIVEISRNCDLNNKNILLVEDNNINQMVERTMLEKYGANVIIADNGYIAYDTFSHSKENEYDLILMDIQMPIMNGYEAAKAIRDCKHLRAKKIPIIAMSANVFPEDVEKAMNSGMNGYIEKPINIQKLLEKINEYMTYY